MVVRNTVFMAYFLFFDWHLSEKFFLFFEESVKLNYRIWINFKRVLFSSLLPSTLVDWFLFLCKSINRINLSVAISIIVSELSLIHFLLLPSIHSETFFIVYPIGPQICLSLILPDSISMSGAVTKIALVKAAVCPVILAVALWYAVYVLSSVVIVIDKLLNPKSVSQAVWKRSFVGCFLVTVNSLSVG